MVAVLLNAADARARVAAGVGSDLAIRHHASVQELFSSLEGGGLALTIIDAADASGRSNAPTIATIRRSFPTIPMLAYCSLSAAPSSTVVDAVRAGVTGLVFRGVDDTPHAMREAIRAARQGAVSRRVYDEIARHLPVSALPFLRYAVTRAGDDPSVEDAATALGVDRKTLFNWLRECGLLAPSAFISWTRLALGVAMLEDPGRTAERVALDLGFPSGMSFRNMLRRYTKMTSSEIRSAGGLEYVLELFVSRLVAQRKSAGPSEATSFDDQWIRARSH